MDTGHRIRTAREQKKLTLDEVAQRCGTTKQTIYKYENGIVKKIPYDRIELLAEVLEVTPAYLFGWEEKEISPAKQELSEGEKMLLDLFSKVPEDRQQLVLQMIRAALSTPEQ